MGAVGQLMAVPARLDYVAINNAGKTSGAMVGIISAPLGGCVPATYY